MRVAVACGYANGGPSFESHVIGTNGSLKFSQHGEKFVRLGTGEQWEEVPFEEPPAEFFHEWKSFATAIEQDLEPPSDGMWGRQVMEILFAAERSSISGREVVLDSGLGWIHQRTGSPITIEHGWH